MVWGLGFRVWGFRGLGFRGLGFWVLGLRVCSCWRFGNLGAWGIPRLAGGFGTRSCGFGFKFDCCAVGVLL